MNRQKPFGSMTNEAHEQAAYRVATEGIVLLKNEAQKKEMPLLPLSPDSYKKYWLWEIMQHAT